MSKKNKLSANLGLIIGVLGIIAGIWMMAEENWMIGIFGTIASAGIAYKGYMDWKASKE